MSGTAFHRVAQLDHLARALLAHELIGQQLDDTADAREQVVEVIALVLDLQSAARYLAKIAEPVDVSTRSKSRGPPYWKRTVLRRKASR